ncbi:MAG: hypothetical protein FJ125_08180, partial [Deltaproteobacteria bacterium]|nr:hypothetical protein [Deltaproteobacteria bacterium]
HGTYSGNPLLGQPGQAGRAVDFQATGYVVTPVTIQTLFGNDGEGTVTALAKLPAAFANFQTSAWHVRHQVWSTNAYWQGVSTATAHGVAGVHFWNFYTGSENDRVSVATNPGKWVHLAWSLQGGRLRAYVNGVESSVASHEDNALSGGGTFFIGCYVDDSSTPQPPMYPSQVQHVAVFPLALGAERIRAQAMAAKLSVPGTADNPALSCKAIKEADAAAATGQYWIDPDGPGGAGSTQQFCEMGSEGGGWTRCYTAASGTLGWSTWQFPGNSCFGAGRSGDLLIRGAANNNVYIFAHSTKTGSYQEWCSATNEIRGVGLARQVGTTVNYWVNGACYLGGNNDSGTNTFYSWSHNCGGSNTISIGYTHGNGCDYEDYALGDLWVFWR